MCSYLNSEIDLLRGEARGEKEEEEEEEVEEEVEGLSFGFGVVNNEKDVGIVLLACPEQLPHEPVVFIT